MQRYGDVISLLIVVITIGMIIAGPLLAYWFDNSNWLWLMTPIIMYLS